MSRFSFILIGGLLLVLEVGLGGLLTLGTVQPSLTLPFVVYVALRRGPIEGNLFGAAVGLLLDVLGALPLGATMFAYATVGFVCGKLGREGPLRVLWPWTVCVLASALWAQAIANYLLARGTGASFVPLFVRSGAPAALYTALLGLVWFLSPLHRERVSY